MQQQLSDLYCYLKGALRYKRLAMGLALLLASIAWLVVWWMPDRYESKAKVHIDSATIIRPLMHGMVIEPDVAALIRIIQQLMFTRPNLEKIIALSLLSDRVNNEAERQVLIEQLKTDITIKSSGNRDIFDIAYAAATPDLAKSVVQAVLTVFSEQTEGKTLADSSDAQKFIDQQIRDYEIRMHRAEKDREDFHRRHLDVLTGDADQFQALQRFKQEAQSAQTVLQQALARKNVLAQQLKTVQQSDQDWSVSNLAPDASPEDSRIEALRDKKTTLLLKYTEQHPEVASIDRLIESLQAEKKQRQKTAVSADGVMPADKMANPYVQSLQTAFDSAEADVAATQAVVTALNSRIVTLEEGLKERLALETEMKSLNRDYDTINKQYAELLARREQAHITERVDDQTARLKFRVADPPSKAVKPSYPNRTLIYSLVLVLSVLLGFGSGLLLYCLRPTFISSRQVRAVTGLPILGTVSISETAAPAKAFDRLVVASTAALLMGYSGLMALEWLHG